MKLNNLDIVQGCSYDLLILSAINNCHVQDLSCTSMAYSRAHKNWQLECATIRQKVLKL